MPNSNTPETTETKAIRTVSGALDVLNAKLGGTAGDIPADATKVDALKKVYATLGGTPADVADISTTSEMIEKLAAVAEGGGGGGDSDFSTAEVTVINPDTFELSIALPVIHPRLEAVMCANISGIAEHGAGETVEVVLYHNTCAASWNEPGYKIETTGDIEYIPDDGAVIITGNGTITFVQDTM